MDSGVLTSIIVAVSAMGVAGITGWYAYRGSRKNSETTRAVEQSKQSTESLEHQVGLWREDVVALRTQRAEDSRIYEEHRNECSRQIAELSKQLDDIRRQRDRDEERHRRERREMQQRIDALLKWVRAVAPVIRERGIPFPPLPPGVFDFGEFPDDGEHA